MADPGGVEKYGFVCWALVFVCIGWSCSPAEEADSPQSRRIRLQTTQGEILLLLDDPAQSPASRFFREQCANGAYDGTYFHRVAPGYLIQGGDPHTRDKDRDNDGLGGVLDSIEFGEWKLHDSSQGAVFFASGREEEANLQFFISLVEDETLLENYRRVGEVIEGMKVVERISEEPGSLNSELGGFNPYEEQFLESCRVVDESKPVEGAEESEEN